MSYNLLEEQWIPVLRTKGKFERVGIRAALVEAGNIRQIAASNPMDRVAIFRFLLALLYWCRGNPTDNVDTTSGDSFPVDWFKKLDDNRDCFNLLGEGTRFYQDRDAQRARPATDLLQEIPTGNNFWHFRHSTDNLDGLCFACCAMGLLRLPLFSVSGLPDLKAGINGTPPVYVIPWAKSLLDTLRTNWVPRGQLGVPAWFQADVRTSPGQEVPLLTGFTLLSRRVWLHDPQLRGTCIGCGGKGAALIRTCEFQTAGEQKNALWNDPHVVYSGDDKRRAATAQDLTAAGKFWMDRPWLDLIARMIEVGTLGFHSKPTSFLIVGFATHQAKNIDVWERTIDVPPAPPIEETSASLLRQWRKQTAGLVPSLVRKVKSPREKARSRKHVEIASFVAGIRPDVEARVSAKAGELIAGTNETWEKAAAEYRPMMEGIARSVSPGFTTAAVERRRQIAKTVPNMRQEAEGTEKRRTKKGGGK